MAGRPRNRRALILAAASDLFCRNGFPQVSMSDIAAEVGIGPSALYRHFAGKQQLLAEVVTDALTAVRDAVTAAEPGDRVRALAAAVLADRRIGVLWQRESRHLPAAEQTRLRRVVRRIRAALTGGEPHGWLAFCAVLSVSFQRIELPAAEYTALLADIVESVLQAEIPDTGPVRRPRRAAVDRRTELAETAVRLFAERGYQAVGIDEIGAAAGIAGPSIYHHFTGKLELLTTAMHAGADALEAAVPGVLESADPAAALRGLVASFVDSAFAHPDVLALLITEVAQLPDGARKEIVARQRHYLAHWVRLLRLVDPDLGFAPARVRVQAALTVINDVAGTRRLAPAAVVTVVVAMLRVG